MTDINSNSDTDSQAAPADAPPILTDGAGSQFDARVKSVQSVAAGDSVSLTVLTGLGNVVACYIDATDGTAPAEHHFKRETAHSGVSDVDDSGDGGKLTMVAQNVSNTTTRYRSWPAVGDKHTVTVTNPSSLTASDFRIVLAVEEAQGATQHV